MKKIETSSRGETRIEYIIHHRQKCLLWQEEFSGRPNICLDIFMENELGVFKRIIYRRKHEVSMVNKWLIAESCPCLSQATCLDSYNTTVDVEAHKDPQSFEKPDHDPMNYFKDKGKIIACHELAILNCVQRCYRMRLSFPRFLHTFVLLYLRMTMEGNIK